jgi:hypothetical protein
MQIDLKNNDVLPKITDLALDKKPPFEDKDKSDKGFKDALIYFSVLEYLQETHKIVIKKLRNTLLFKLFVIFYNNYIVMFVESFF